MLSGNGRGSSRVAPDDEAARRGDARAANGNGIGELGAGDQASPPPDIGLPPLRCGRGAAAACGRPRLPAVSARAPVGDNRRGAACSSRCARRRPTGWFRVTCVAPPSHPARRVGRTPAGITVDVNKPCANSLPEMDMTNHPDEALARGAVPARGCSAPGGHPHQKVAPPPPGWKTALALVEGGGSAHGLSAAAQSRGLVHAVVTG